MKSRLRPLCVLILSLVFTQWGHAVGYSEPKYGIRISQAWSQMPEGVRLTADLFMPRVPRKTSASRYCWNTCPIARMESRARNYSLYSYFVQRG